MGTPPNPSTPAAPRQPLADHSTPELQGLGGTPGAPPLHPTAAAQHPGGVGISTGDSPTSLGSIPGLCHPHSTAIPPHVQMELPGLQSVPTAPRPGVGHHQTEPGPLPCTLPSDIHQHSSDPLSLLSCRHTARGSQPAPIRRCSRPHCPTALCWALSSGSHLPGTGQPSTGCSAPAGPPQGQAPSLPAGPLCSVLQGTIDPRGHRAHCWLTVNCWSAIGQLLVN